MLCAFNTLKFGARRVCRALKRCNRAIRSWDIEVSFFVVMQWCYESIFTGDATNVVHLSQKCAVCYTDTDSNRTSAYRCFIFKPKYQYLLMVWWVYGIKSKLRMSAMRSNHKMFIWANILGRNRAMKRITFFNQDLGKFLLKCYHFYFHS